MSEIKTAGKDDKIVQLSDTVKFTVAYPKEYKGKRYMKESSVHTLHKLHAERLVKKGLGKIQEK